MYLHSTTVSQDEPQTADMLILTSLPKPHDQLQSKGVNVAPAHQPSPRSMDDLALEVEDLFERQLRIESLLSMSNKIQGELKERLQSCTDSMLPSHNYTLPAGQEEGIYLALEVGGSNLRIALVELDGQAIGHQRLRVRHMESSPIDANIRQLRGFAFFDWIAERIRYMLAIPNQLKWAEPLRMGVAWAFPVDQTSLRSGNVLGMGKGFHCSNQILGHDLGQIIEQACKRAVSERNPNLIHLARFCSLKNKEWWTERSLLSQHVNVRLESIVNDSSSTLLANAYINPSTRLAVILGTGINAAVHLPIRALHQSKFGSRPMPQTSEATHVLVNTEISMLGKSSLPSTRWDKALNNSHSLPDYQPLEYMVGGGYMGEIVRLILVEATAAAGLFGGLLPPSLANRYSLDTRTLAAIERDTSPSLAPSLALFLELHPSPSSRPPTYTDMSFIRQVIRSVSRRSSAYFTTSLHALCCLLHNIDELSSSSDSDAPTISSYSSSFSGHHEHIIIGCDGSVINRYPGYMARSQEILDNLIAIDDRGNNKTRVILEKTQDRAVLGAGVAGAMAAIHLPS